MRAAAAGTPSRGVVDREAKSAQRASEASFWAILPKSAYVAKVIFGKIDPKGERSELLGDFAEIRLRGKGDFR